MSSQLIAKTVDKIEAVMLDLPQVDCPVQHHFGPGIYIREVTLKANTLALGHRQKEPHLNIMLTGKVAIVDGSGIKEIFAPSIFTGSPGRKFGYVIEECTWLNIYPNPTNESDIDVLESMFLDKSAFWVQKDVDTAIESYYAREEDREDYKVMLKEIGFTEKIVRAQSESTGDLMDMPWEYKPYVSVRNSYIEGRGLFLTMPVKPKSIIAPARINGKRTPAGRYVNHSKNPNCSFHMCNNGDIYLVANRHIGGCVGSNSGEELTVDYRGVLKLHNIGGKLCQE